MAIKSMSKDDVELDKYDQDLEKIEKLEREIVNQIKYSINNMTDVEKLYDLREFIETAIFNWERLQIKLEETED